MNNTVLLVEDDRMLAEMYEEKLSMEGYKVIQAEDGKIALKKAKKQPNVILLDIMMPGLNGFEVLKELKQDMETTSIPVIVLTNVGSESADSDQDLALSLGAECYLVKSYHTPDEVVSKINTILNRTK
ncbi:MAG: response regulator transcription factor [bacterium]|nr:response regulator transcription factor [bacterium]